jgi:single-stranded DNA-binding protein
VFVDAELDWREWTDPDEKKREAVTFKARQVLFEGARRAVAATGEDGEPKDAAPADAEPTDTTPIGVPATGSEGTASADDLPF